MKALIVGDLTGKPGRDILEKYLISNKKKYDMVIINGENSAGGFGLTPKIADKILKLGVDVITSGNHIWDKKDIYPYLDSEERVLRPLNYISTTPGHGSTVIETKTGYKVGVINIQGRIFMPEIESPFLVIEEEIEKLQKETNMIIVDFHAEASSEKIAMGWFLDGKASVVCGTHTHVLTADNRILAKGTGYITDLGMTGGFDGIIGMEKENIIQKFIDALPAKFKICKTNLRLNGIEVDLNNETGRCENISRVDVGMDELE